MGAKLKKSIKRTKEKERLLGMLLQDKVEGIFESFMSKSIELALEEELCDYLGRKHYQRKQNEMQNYRNGYQDRVIRTKSGRLKIKKPRLRKQDPGYKSKLMERVISLEESLKKMLLEGYVRGLSTRDIEETFIDQDGKALLSKSGVSNLTSKLNEEYKLFMERDLSGTDIVYLFIDGVYEAVKKYTNNQALLCAWGITSSGEKQLLSIEAVASESEASYSDFIENMLKRGLRHPLLVISDGSKGLHNAIARKLPISRRQRCIAHKLRNIMSKVPKEYQDVILTEVKKIYYADDRATAEVYAAEFVKKYAEQLPSTVKCFLDDLDQCLTHLDFPASQRRFIRTTNLIERSFVEQKRRTKVFPQHQSEKSAIGLVFAILQRASDKWKKVKMGRIEKEVLLKIRNIICPKNNDNVNLSMESVA